METDIKLSTSLKNLLHLIFKRKTQILLLFGAIVCTVGIGSFMQTPIYEATAKILIKVGRENVYVPAADGAGPIIDKGDHITAEIEILKSRFLAEKLVEFLGPAVIYKDLDGTGPELLNRAVARFQKSLRVEGVKQSNVINISFKHRSPRLAATVINTLVDLYLERHLEVHKRRDPQGFFRKQYLLLKDQGKLAEEKLQAFRNQHDLTALDGEQDLLLRQEADLSAELNRSLSHNAEIESRILQLRSQLTTTSQTIRLNLDNKTMEDLCFSFENQLEKIFE